MAEYHRFINSFLVMPLKLVKI